MYGNKKQKKQSKKYLMSACFPAVEERFGVTLAHRL
jgi:hypothetical protein